MHSIVVWHKLGHSFISDSFFLLIAVEDFLAHDLYRLGDGELQKQVGGAPEVQEDTALMRAALLSCSAIGVPRLGSYITIEETVMQRVSSSNI